MIRTATIHLLDGDATGSLKCSLGHWGVIVYKISRDTLKEKSAIKKYEKALPILKQCGIYFLFGKSTSDKYKRGVYVGQAVTRANGHGVLGRVMEHDDIDWCEAVIFVSDNEEEHPLEPGLRYLENRFHEMAKEADRYDLLNGNNPNLGSPTNVLRSSLEDFISYAKTALFALGYNVLEPCPKDDVVDAHTTQPEHLNEELLLSLVYKPLTSERASTATGRLTANGFVVMAGSEFCPTETPSCRDDIRELRRVHKNEIENDKLTSDITFGSPSGAASFVCGSPRNGKVAWYDPRSKKNLGELLGGKKKD